MSVYSSAFQLSIYVDNTCWVVAPSICSILIQVNLNWFQSIPSNVDRFWWNQSYLNDVPGYLFLFSLLPFWRTDESNSRHFKMDYFCFHVAHRHTFSSNHRYSIKRKTKFRYLTFFIWTNRNSHCFAYPSLWKFMLCAWFFIISKINCTTNFQQYRFIIEFNEYFPWNL